MAAKKTAHKKGRPGHPYYPAKTFDDDLVALVSLYKGKKWSFSNVDLKQLEADGKAQRDERKTHDDLESEYAKVHSEFGLATEARYQRFSSALNAARGAFKNDAGVTKQLDKFKRSAARRPAKKGTGPAT